MERESPTQHEAGRVAAARILVVEDDRSLSEALAYNLRKAGYEPMLAGDGVEGLAVARQELAFLANQRGRIVSRDRLLDAVWSDEVGAGSRTVDVHIHRLRALLEVRPSDPEYLHTARGLGYRLQYRPR